MFLLLFAIGGLHQVQLCHFDDKIEQEGGTAEMKPEISPKIVMAIIVVVLIVIVGFGWKMLAPKQESQADKDAYFATHPGAKAASDNMSKMSANPTPPAGAKGGSSN